jgi:hypothetical protein
LESSINKAINIANSFKQTPSTVRFLHQIMISRRVNQDPVVNRIFTQGIKYIANFWIKGEEVGDGFTTPQLVVECLVSIGDAELLQEFLRKGEEDWLQGKMGDAIIVS